MKPQIYIIIGILLTIMAVCFFAGRATVNTTTATTNIVTHKQIDSIKAIYQVQLTDSIASVRWRRVIRGRDTVYTLDSTWVKRAATLQALLNSAQTRRSVDTAEATENTTATTAQDGHTGPWLGATLVGGISGPLAWPPSLDEAMLGPRLRFGQYESKITPRAGYNWKRKEWRADIIYEQKIF